MDVNLSSPSPLPRPIEAINEPRPIEAINEPQPIEAINEPQPKNLQLKNIDSPWKVNFCCYVEPFIQLLVTMSNYIVNFTSHITHISYRYLTAAQVVFSRLIYEPEFDPNRQTCKEKIEKFERQIPRLLEEVGNLEQKFWRTHLILRDLAELQQVYQAVKEPFFQLQRWVDIPAVQNGHLVLHQQLRNLHKQYSKAWDNLNNYLSYKSFGIIEQFKSNIDVLIQAGFEVPSDIQNELKEIERLIELLMKDYISPQTIKDLRAQIKLLTHLPRQLNQDQLNPAAFPLKLRNIGNSCYIDSVLQALLCIDEVCEQISRPLACDKLGPKFENETEEVKKKEELRLQEEHRNRLAIQQELIKFIKYPQGNPGEGPYSPLEYLLLLFQGPSLYRLRKAIFQAELHTEFYPERMYDQLDAASVMELFIQEFLDSKFFYQQRAKVEEFPGLEFHGPLDSMKMLHLNFPLDHPEERVRNAKLMVNLIHVNFWKQQQVEENKDYQRKFNPQEGKVINQEKADLIQDRIEKKFEKFTQWHCLYDLPNVLVLHFKRFINIPHPNPKKSPILQKIKNEVKFPETGVIDLNRYQEAREEIPKKDAHYRIKSFVIHRGSLNAGHYISYVRKGSKCFKCDDINPRYYQEISEQEFLSQTDAYLVVLERLSGEELQKHQEALALLKANIKG